MKRQLSLYIFLILTLVYVGLVFIIPPDPATLERYHISVLHAQLLNLTIIVPLVGIWLVALYGFWQFKKYVHIISESPEGAAFKVLSYGLMVLAYSLPLNSIASAALRYWGTARPQFLPTSVILRNYVTLLLSLIAFSLIARGAQLLVMSNKSSGKKSRVVLPDFIAPLLIVLSTVFTWLVTTHPADASTSYYLPNWLIICTLVIPYLVAWLFGILGPYYLYSYKSKLKGAIYRQAFANLSWGIGIVTVISILIQLLTTISGQLNRLNLTPILLILYGLVLLYAAGFWLIARGSHKLKKIEEV